VLDVVVGRFRSDDKFGGYFFDSHSSSQEADYLDLSLAQPGHQFPRGRRAGMTGRSQDMINRFTV
jgi:hypothetical protein